MRDGSTRRAHYRRAAATGKRIKVLADAPRRPPGADALWQAYLALDQQRAFEGMAGQPLPITYAEVAAYQRCMGVSLHPDEVKAILRVDAEFRQHQAEQRDKPRSPDDED